MKNTYTITTNEDFNQVTTITDLKTNNVFEIEEFDKKFYIEFYDTNSNETLILVEKETNNKVSLENYGIEEAIEMIDSLEYCTNCYNCIDCRKCDNCVECEQCHKLKNEEYKYNEN